MSGRRNDTERWPCETHDRAYLPAIVPKEPWGGKNTHTHTHTQAPLPREWGAQLIQSAGSGPFAFRSVPPRHFDRAVPCLSRILLHGGSKGAICFFGWLSFLSGLCLLLFQGQFCTIERADDCQLHTWSQYHLDITKFYRDWTRALSAILAFCSVALLHWTFCRGVKLTASIIFQLRNSTFNCLLPVFDRTFKRNRTDLLRHCGFCALCTFRLLSSSIALIFVYTLAVTQLMINYPGFSTCWPLQKCEFLDCAFEISLHPLSAYWTSIFCILALPCLERLPHRTCITQRFGNPGPKSGRFRLLNCRSLCWTLLHIVAITTFWNGGEGCASPMSSAEVPLPDWAWHLTQNGTKPQHGMRPSSCFGKPWLSQDRAVTKRSICRAYRRACREGIAWYRGHCYTPNDFPTQLIPHKFLPSTQSPLPPHQRNNLSQFNHHHKDKRRFTTFHWNCGGLSQHRLDEVRTWAHTQQLDMLLITETRWTWTGEWQDSSWHYLHSGDSTSRGKGILCMIHASTCSAQQIRWSEVQIGRLIHVQIRFQHRCLDAIVCYQHPFSHARISDRRNWWDSLDKLLRDLPRRNVLLVAGDFNCSLPQAKSHAGPSFFRWEGQDLHGTCHSDQNSFMSILRSHGLNAINTWNSKLGPTFVHSKGCSRIDYFLVRHHVADGIARDVKYLRSAPFLMGTEGHTPMICSVPKQWFPAAQKHPHSISPHQRLLGRCEYINQTEKWHRFMQCSNLHLQACFDQYNHHDPNFLSHLHDTAITCYNESFPSNPPKFATAWHSCTDWIRNKWAHRSICQEIAHSWSLRVVDLKSVFAFWHHQTRFQVMTRSHKKHAITVRQQKFDEIIHSASQAANQHNMFQLFQIINRFSPKQPRKRMQLRTQSGQLATPVEEHSILYHFVEQMWHASPMIDAQLDPAPGTPFTQWDVWHALATIPINKAVAPGFAPGLIWRTHADTLAPRIFQILQTWWGSPAPHIPQEWKDGWLSWLPKPGRVSASPDSLRPIALQEPVGKSLIGMLSRIGQEQSAPAMIGWPIWAYLPFRSTQDGLLRVAAHCREAEALLRNSRSTPHQRSQGIPCLPICGAIQLFVDLSRAFDSIDRNHLFTHLQELGVCPPIATLLKHWHTNTRYVVRTCSSDSPIGVFKGVRQGCKAAPWLWNCVLTLLLRDLSKDIPAQWIREHVNLFADDSQAGSVFRNSTELKLILHYFGCLLSTLQKYGLIINQSKSRVLFSMHGHASRQCRADHTFWRDGKEWLRIVSPAEFSIPIERSVKYLGTIISYHHMADKNVHHRAQLTKIAFGRLSKWLTCRRGLTTNHKFQLWQTCVLPVATYGIFSIGITLQGAQTMAILVRKMLRQIARDHPYHTGRTNEQVFQRHGFPCPYLLLWQSADSLHTSMTQRCLRVHADDLIQLQDWGHLLDVKNLLMSLHWSGTANDLGGTPTSEVHSEPYHCKLCDFSTMHVSALRRHYTVAPLPPTHPNCIRGCLNTHVVRLTHMQVLFPKVFNLAKLSYPC